MKKTYHSPKLIDRGSAIAQTLEGGMVALETGTNIPDFKEAL